MSSEPNLSDQVEPVEATPAEVTPKVEPVEVATEVESTKMTARQHRLAILRAVAVWILRVVLFPFVLIRWAFRAFAHKIRFKLTVKTTIIFTTLFAIALLAYTIFLVLSIQNRIGEQNEEYFRTLWISTILLMIIVTAVIASIGALASSYMLRPIRTMSHQLNGITSENLSARIDITESQDELRELTHRINTMLDNLEQSFMRQKNFVSDASHELRTPIAIISGYTELLQRWGKTKPEVLEEAISTIAREAANMKHLIEQLLFLTGLGSFRPTVETFVVSEVVDEVLASARKVGKQKFGVQMDGQSPTLCTNKDLYCQVLRILIDNAVKYTPNDGQITIRIIDQETKTVVEVVDSGMGISAEDLPHIFERFYRCDKARTRQSGSSGLGLAIAKSIVKVLGGSLTATSAGSGRGATFALAMLNDTSPKY